MALLEIERVSKGFGGLMAVNGVSCAVGKGEVVGLIGPNGAGKTTLLRVMGGALRPSRGEVLLGGRSMQGMSGRSRARSVGQVPQVGGLGIDFRALDFVLMGRYPHLGLLQPEGGHDRAAARAAMVEIELEGMQERLTSTLSAGERQRLLFARARCQEAEVLLCDEPTANLDLRHRAVLFAVLRDCAAHGGGVLAAVHDLDLAGCHCDRLVLLCAGRVLAQGPPAAVLTPELVRAAYAVHAEVHPDPVTGTPRVSVLGPA